MGSIDFFDPQHIREAGNRSLVPKKELWRHTYTTKYAHFVATNRSLDGFPLFLWSWVDAMDAATPPVGARRIGQVHLKDSNEQVHIELTLWDCRPSQESSGSSPQPDLASDRMSSTPSGTPSQPSSQVISILRSSLQKSVRRGHSEAAYRCALTLGQTDPLVLARRLPIIMCEDAMLHPHLASLSVWIIMSMQIHGNRALLEEDIRCLCDCARDLAGQTSYRDSISPTTMQAAGSIPLSLDKSLFHPEIRSAVEDDPPACLETAIASLYIRSLYGGMANDCTLCHTAAWLWEQRCIYNGHAWLVAFLSHWRQIHLQMIEASAALTLPLPLTLARQSTTACLYDPSCIELAAFDMHVTNLLTRHGWKTLLPAHWKEEASSDNGPCGAIYVWHYRSNVNVRHLDYMSNASMVADHWRPRLTAEEHAMLPRLWHWLDEAARQLSCKIFGWSTAASAECLSSWPLPPECRLFQA